MPGLNALGSQLRRGDGEDPEGFTVLANVTSITGPEMERETVDVTSHDSPGGWMEFVGGLKDGGEVEIEFNYDPSEPTHAVLQEDFDAARPRTYQVVFPDPDQHAWQFQAILTNLSAEMPHDDKIEGEMTLKVTGKPELTTVNGDA
ncbi:phage tail tube protein [Lipingzhangella sp. LS1_29]|uniref:Phage tail tube protein n=1 Tax=Lipingzhangella rawalii TaxID=2055835 RepID=A0ABU2H317_9ACTN|nr:phage tail tube protein [Lipingzhangella rawalii]MDS1269692.1 phage tail tube protein [Lipingzhangella rawalii]